ncbi:hypothetical protein [Methanoculleus bourgensis]|uniref:Uncharacterized protein n=1 Tax=Methanoculleus bourgensis TaxID=83986 RepID=A0A0X3BMX7_9EURY|nr:hypothetical protein [Methanoculleus bourgensis]CVK33466.1 conserved protein of unknown function [Methanoculleus bourgensis]
MRSYVENQSPGRYEEFKTGPSRAQVCFINDTGVFTEYIVDLSGGEIISTTYVSEEDLPVNKSAATAQAFSGKPPDARVENIVLRAYDDTIVWEVTVRAGSKADVVQVPADPASGHPPWTATPGFGAVVAVCGIGMGIVLCRKRR